MNDVCWFTGLHEHRGYAYIKSEGRTQRAHRVFYKSIVGDIPEGLELDHLCLNRNCVNPFHLEPVTGEENIKRQLANSVKISGGHRTCKRGHIAVVGKKCRKCHAYIAMLSYKKRSLIHA